RPAGGAPARRAHASGGVPDAIDAVRMQYGVDLWDVFTRLSLGLSIEVRGPVPPVRTGVVVNCDLPTRPGRVVRISEADELAQLPDVISVRMSTRAGDTIGTRLHSASKSSRQPEPRARLADRQ
ncbi:hypothetical protein AB0G02_31535, partial [Actinosynnema sp. NPDC023658]|uniref:hypothetical protein n=1 Tax=Actinosynnema sp. NPDC023658 TaxID=3155465 RepID=UPI0033FF07FB